MATDQEPFPSQVADKYVIRFPDGMRDRLKQAAAANNRTLNAEIVKRLEDSFDERSLPADEIPQQEMLYEMRLTQLLLERNAISAEAEQLRRQRLDVEDLENEGKIDEETERAMKAQIAQERAHLDERMVQVLAKLSSLEQFRKKHLPELAATLPVRHDPR